MEGSRKVLTVSYGTFSCTLEGFEDNFDTMRAIAEYFRDLAAEDRYFGAEPPTPDVEMLQRIAEREVKRRVEASVADDGVHLRTQATPAPEPAVLAEAGAGDAQAGLAEPQQPAPAPSPEALADKLSRIRSAVSQDLANQSKTLPPQPMPALDTPRDTRPPISHAASEVTGEEDAEPQTAEPQTAEPPTTEEKAAAPQDRAGQPEPEAAPAADAATKAEDTQADPVAPTSQEAPRAAAAEDPARVIRVRKVPGGRETDSDVAAATRPTAPEETSTAQDPTDTGAAETNPTDTGPAETGAAETGPAETGTDTGQAPADTPADPDPLEAELMAELAAVEKELGLAPSVDATSAETETPFAAPPRKSTPASFSEQPAEDRRVAQLMDQADAEQDDPASRRRQAAIQHLRAAVRAHDPQSATSEADRVRPYRKDLSQLVKTPETQKAPPLVLVSEQRITPQPTPVGTPGPGAAEQGADMPKVQRREDLDVDATALDLTGPGVPSRTAIAGAIRDTLRQRRATRADAEAETDRGPDPQKALAEAANFTDFAERMGAKSLPQMLEAAAAYMAGAEGKQVFSQSDVIAQVMESGGDADISREDGLRGFGTLLREGKIRKIRRGQFTISQSSSFMPADRSA